MELINFAKENWDVIAQAPWAFVLCAVIFSGIGYAISGRLTVERLALADDRVTDYKEKLEGKSPAEAQEQIAKLQDEVAALASYGLSSEAQQRLKDSLASVSGNINILKNSDASDCETAS
jgi:hypothetical protein